MGEDRWGWIPFHPPLSPPIKGGEYYKHAIILYRRTLPCYIKFTGMACLEEIGLFAWLPSLALPRSGSSGIISGSLRNHPMAIQQY
jgi:hypothetical protein